MRLLLRLLCKSLFVITGLVVMTVIAVAVSTMIVGIIQVIVVLVLLLLFGLEIIGMG